LKYSRPKYHSLIAIRDQTLHLGSAAIVQLACSGFYDRRADRDPNLNLTRAANIFRDSHPAPLTDILTQIQRDVGLNLREGMAPIPSLEDYFNRHPDERDFVRNFDVSAFIRDEGYRNRTLLSLRTFLEEARLIGHAQNPADIYHFDLNQNTPAEIAYQNRLKELLKNAFLEIYRTPALSQCLDKDEDLGKDLLEMLDGSTYIPLTTYTQYKELLEEIQCPPWFTGNLVLYNERQNQLIAARNKIMPLSENDKNELVKRILRGSDHELSDDLKEIYLDITNLAPALYQGPLMTKVYIDPFANDGDVMVTQNLFQTVCQEAIAEINVQ
jgi:hypothetical protein